MSSRLTVVSYLSISIYSMSQYGLYTEKTKNYHILLYFLA